MGIPTLTNSFFPPPFQSELRFQFPGRRKLSESHPQSFSKSSPWPRSPLHTHLEIDGNDRIKRWRLNTNQESLAEHTHTPNWPLPPWMNLTTFPFFNWMSLTRKRRRREADQCLSSVLCDSERPSWVALPKDVDTNTQESKRKYSRVKEEILKSERGSKPGKSLSQVRLHTAFPHWSSPCTAGVLRYMQHCSQRSHSLPAKNPSTFRIWDQKLLIPLDCEIFLKRSNLTLACKIDGICFSPPKDPHPVTVATLEGNETDHKVKQKTPSWM